MLPMLLTSVRRCNVPRAAKRHKRRDAKAAAFVATQQIANFAGKACQLLSPVPIPDPMGGGQDGAGSGAGIGAGGFFAGALRFGAAFLVTFLAVFFADAFNVFFFLRAGAAFFLLAFLFAFFAIVVLPSASGESGRPPWETALLNSAPRN